MKMKYEYTHGNESEFSGAPGWAKLAISDGRSNAFCNELDYMATAVWSNGRQFKIANPTKFTVVGTRKLVSEESEWNGDGLPPVGCECEYETNGYGIKKVRVECITMDGIAFTWLGEDPRFRGLDCINTSQSHLFRPIRSEEDKKRDVAIANIDVVLLMVRDRSKTSSEIYDAIAAGKIPGVKLED
jgi:hypothetical protein